MKSTVTTVTHEICKISDYPYFVTMTDKKLSGWGRAEGKAAKRVYLCKTLEIAKSLVERIQKRENTGMKNINICTSLPYYSTAKYTVSYDNRPEIAFNY